MCDKNRKIVTFNGSNLWSAYFGSRIAVDGSFFLNSTALKLAWTFAAQALRVGEHIRRSVIEL